MFFFVYKRFGSVFFFSWPLETPVVKSTRCEPNDLFLGHDQVGNGRKLEHCWASNYIVFIPDDWVCWIGIAIPTEFDCRRRRN